MAERLDAMQEAGPPVDLVAAFATPVPFLVICELLGVPEEDRAGFQAISAGRFDLAAGPGSGLAGVDGSLGFLSDLIDRQRSRPGDGLLGQLLREHGDSIDTWELAGIADGLLVGGHDTTASMLALGTLVLLDNPGLAGRLRAGDDPGPVITELLRFLTVAQVAFPRTARDEVVLSGQAIAAGDLVLCSLSAANRDPAAGTGMDAVEPGRDAVSHLAFGHGIHRCVGAPLAQLELGVAYPALLSRFPGLSLAVPATELAFRGFSIVYGLEALPVRW